MASGCVWGGAIHRPEGGASTILGPLGRVEETGTFSDGHEGQI